MDAQRFDTLTRSLTQTGSRRRAVTAALAGALALLGLARPDEAVAGGRCKPKYTECETCKKGKHGKRRQGDNGGDGCEPSRALRRPVLLP